MPTKDEMSQAYVASIEAKVVELETQVSALKQHIDECKVALEEGSSDDGQDE